MLTCPTCKTEMKVIAIINRDEPTHKILDHLKSRKIDPRAGPFEEQAAKEGTHYQKRNKKARKMAGFSWSGKSYTPES